MNLLPKPRSVTELGGTVPDTQPRERTDPSIPSEGYRLTVSSGRVELAGGDDAGLFYGRATLEQLRRLAPDGELPAVEIDDHPDNAVRGVMLDVSRDKVPTMDTLHALIDRLASLKLNHVQLYTEHTFAYRDHEPVWRNASPFTADEIRELAGFCRERHVTLTPNQNCLGHMERWLRHDRYLPLAISPDGWTDPLGRHHGPSTLDPSNPRSLELARSLLAELLPNFDAPWVHVGLDEPWELGDDRLGEYTTYLRALRDAPETRGLEMLVWGEILYYHPELLGDVPEGVSVCVWGYEATYPFQRYADRITGAGLPLWVCPGTSSWNTIGGRWTNARANLLQAAETATDARGYLVTDWGDSGHLQYLPVSEPPLAFAAAVSWCLERNQGLDVAPALDTHVFDDPAGELGAALLALGDAYALVEPATPNMSALCLPLYFPEVSLGRRYTKRFTTEGFRGPDVDAVRSRLDDVRAMVGRSASRRPDASLVSNEIGCACDLLDVLCGDIDARVAGDGTIEAVDATTRTGLADRLAPLLDRHRELWLARNRPGGLDDSVSVLGRVLDRYRT